MGSARQRSSPLPSADEAGDWLATASFAFGKIHADEPNASSQPRRVNLQPQIHSSWQGFSSLVKTFEEDEDCEIDKIKALLEEGESMEDQS